MHTRAISLFALLLACIGLSFGLSACGGDDESTTASVELTELPSDPQAGEPSAPQPPLSPAEQGGGEAGDGGDDDAAGAEDDGDAAGGDAAAGRGVFAQSCAGCHTLAEAGASGSVGPNLDELRPSQERVAAIVRGGGAGMPSFGGTLEPTQIEAVAAYVAGAAGS